MGSETSFNEWEKYMDACAKRLLQDSGENPENSRRPSKSKKGTRRVLRKRGKADKKGKGKVGTNSKKVMEDEVSGQRSRSRAAKRQKSKSKESSEDPEDDTPQKRKRQRSVAYDSGDVDQTV